MLNVLPEGFPVWNILLCLLHAVSVPANPALYKEYFRASHCFCEGESPEGSAPRDPHVPPPATGPSVLDAPRR